MKVGVSEFVISSLALVDAVSSAKEEMGDKFCSDAIKKVGEGCA